MWWMGSKRSWTEGHNAFGTTRTAPRWLLAEGETGGAARHQHLRAHRQHLGGRRQRQASRCCRSRAPRSRSTYTVGANRRFTVPVASAFPSSDGKRYSILVESLNPSTAGALVVERAIYWNTDDEVWGAGSNAVGAIVP